MSGHWSDAPPDRVWNATTPEGRLSIATYRFLKRALVPPFYVVAVPDMTMARAPICNECARRRERTGRLLQLDFDVVQGPNGLARKVELKRGRNGLTEHQKKTVDDLIACGFVADRRKAWMLREMFAGLLGAGFTFLPNVATTVLAHGYGGATGGAWTAIADAVKSGAVVQEALPGTPAGPGAPGADAWKSSA